MTELYQVQRKTFWKGMSTSFSVQTKHLIRICQALGINNFVLYFRIIKYCRK